MTSMNKNGLIVVCIFSLIFALALTPSASMAAKAEKKAKAMKEVAQELWSKPNASFDAVKMGDMSDHDPANWVNPEGDTIKVAVLWAFSGPSTQNAEYAWASATFAAYDINKRGGIWVDGKKKKIALFKADHMSKPDQCKKICERMVLQEKCKILLGTSGSNMMKIINEVADKHNVIAVNIGSLADELQDATNFSRNAFMSSDSTEAVGRGMAYYYGQIRKKEKKFYILCQDYSFGHGLAEGFKKGLKEYYPNAELVGEDYHKLFLTDFAPYVTKIKASGAEVVWTGDWVPDAANLLKQARQLGMKIPLANIYVDNATTMVDIGIEGTKGLVNIKHLELAGAQFNSPGYIKYYKAWNNGWKNKWKTAPYNNPYFEHGNNTLGFWTQQIYWMFSVIERAKSTDAEKIIKVWEGDTYQFVNGRIAKMRACDHKGIQGFRVAEYVVPSEQKVSMNIPPYYWRNDTCAPGPSWAIPAAKVLPWMDQKLDRCKGKNAWGE
jgi:branched-chain amino acid transport system substrate-binding protein